MVVMSSFRINRQFLESIVIWPVYGFKYKKPNIGDTCAENVKMLSLAKVFLSIYCLVFTSLRIMTYFITSATWRTIQAQTGEKNGSFLFNAYTM